MSENQVSQRIEALISPVMTDLGLELYDLEYNGGIVKITVDTPPGSPGGIDVDQLSRCTRLISRELDHDDPVPGHYTLEVSSPGLERNLRLPRHFQREVGKTAAVRLSDVLNGERRLTGVIESAGVETFLLRLANGEERVVPYDRIDRAKTVFVWQAQPKPGKGVGAGGSKGASKKSAAKDTSKSAIMSSLPASTADSEQEIDDFLDRCDDLEDLDTDLGQDELVQEIASYEDQESAES
ncbi:MAG: ribosome maturation factor RimP [Actinobacteria bacterium]|nr:ribosome maturation factor RimP [Actinomycetota bacterium]